MFWKIKVVPAVPPCPGHRRAVVEGKARAEKVGISWRCFMEQIGLGGTEGDKNNPRRLRKRQELKGECFGKFQLVQATQRGSNVLGAAQRQRAPGSKMP